MNANFPQFMNGPQFAYYYNMADMMDKLANGVLGQESIYTGIHKSKCGSDVERRSY
ncbi:hypothetical protein NXX55_27815 [Bacteroides thetaiotaomicron]|nr:hypothetical protein [Bacteroides thetaiotaomicron]